MIQACGKTYIKCNWVLPTHSLAMTVLNFTIDMIVLISLNKVIVLGLISLKTMVEQDTRRIKLLKSSITHKNSTFKEWTIIEHIQLSILSLNSNIKVILLLINIKILILVTFVNPIFITRAKVIIRCKSLVLLSMGST